MGDDLNSVRPEKTRWNSIYVRMDNLSKRRRAGTDKQVESENENEDKAGQGQVCNQRTIKKHILKKHPREEPAQIYIGDENKIEGRK